MTSSKRSRRRRRRNRGYVDKDPHKDRKEPRFGICLECLIEWHTYRYRANPMWYFRPGSFLAIPFDCPKCGEEVPLYNSWYNFKFLIETTLKRLREDTYF
jgi:hypothetical protein